MEKNIEKLLQDGSKLELGREHCSPDMEVAPSLDLPQNTPQTSSLPNNGNNGTSSTQNDSNDSEE
ncbi:MAG: hypothetical protein HDT11_00900 [Helicobacter sp.]|nr:hypothetical protein [Helicobacter sp.]